MLNLIRLSHRLPTRLLHAGRRAQCLRAARSHAWAVVLALSVFGALQPAAADTHSQGLGLLGEPPRGGADIAVDVNLVLLPVTVTDGKGQVITDLDRGHFNIYEEREQQQISYFEQVHAPLSVGLVFDVSGSMRRRIDTAQDALASLFKHASPGDEAFLMTFAGGTVLRLDFTRELDQIRYSLLMEEIGGRTALTDALFEGLCEMRRAGNQRKAIVLISDAGGNMNTRSRKELLRQAVEADVRVYPVIVDFHVQNHEQRLGRAFLEKLAHRTGGRRFMVKRNKDMAKTMEKLGRLLHSHYLIGYYPQREAPEGKWQKIRVRLDAGHPRGDLRAYAPGGYYRPGGSEGVTLDESP